MNFIRKLFTYLKNDQEFIQEVTFGHFDELKKSINILEFIDFSSSKIPEIKEKIQQFDNNIDNIYLVLTKYLLSGNFLKVSELDATELNEIIGKKIEIFLTGTPEPEEIEKSEEDENTVEIIKSFIKKIKSNLDKLKDDILKIRDIRTFYSDKKLNDIDDIGSNNIISLRSKAFVNRKLFYISYSLIEYEFNFQNISSFKLIKYNLLGLFQELKELNGSDEVKSILIEKIQFDLYKLFGGTEIDYHYNHTVSTLKLKDFSKDTLIYKEARIFLDFIDIGTKNPSNIMKKNIKKTLSKKIPLKDIILRLVYYKDCLKDDRKIKEIYEYYRDNIFDIDKKDDRINFIYIGNNYLSSLIYSYDSSREDIVDRDYEKEIEILYKEIKEVANTINSLYSNFFTSYKYAKYLYIKSRKQLYKMEYSKAKRTLENARNSIENSEKAFFKDTNGSKLYYSVNEELIRLPNDNSVQYLYHPFLNIPYNQNNYQQIISSLKSEIDLGLSTINLKKSIFRVQDDMDNHKTDSMQVLGVFAGIVLFASGTIQIFSKIDDLGSALIFVGLYSSSIMFLLAGVNFSNYSEFRKNRSILFSALGFGVLFITLMLNLIFGGNILNINSINESRVKAIDAQTELIKIIQDGKIVKKNIEEANRDIDIKIEKLENLIKLNTK